MRVVPLGDKIVVRREEASEKTAGGIVLPSTAQDRPRIGRVLSVGDGKLLKDGSRAAPQVSEGDRVLFSSYAGAEIKVENQELLILSENEVLAVID